MIVPVARIEAHTTPRVTRAEVQSSLFGGPSLTRVIWELPGSRDTSWLVQVPREFATDQLRRFASLHIAAEVVALPSVEWPETTGNPPPTLSRPT